MRHHNCRFLISMFVFVILGAGSVAANEGTSYHVAGTGDDRNPGTEERPLRTIQKALDRAKAGDTVTVKAGVYRERVFVKSSGQAGRPIVIQGEKGAILDGGDILKGWTAAPEMGPGVYKNADKLPYLPSHMTWKNKHVVWMSDPQRKGSHSAPGWALLKKEAADAGWDGVEALAGNQGNTAYVRLRHGQHPDREEVAFAPAGQGAFNIDKHSHIVIRGFTIRNAWSAVRITNGASDNLVEKNALRGGRYTVLVERGSARNRIAHNDITLDYVYADIGPPQGRSAVDFRAYTPIRLFAWEQIHAGVHLMESGAANEVSDNHIYRGHAGVYCYAVTPEGNKRLRVCRNVIHHCAGYCLVLEGAAESEWHDNLLYESHMTVRLEQNPHGPIYIYRNRFYHESQEMQKPLSPRGYLSCADINFNLYQATPQTTVYVYHNSMSGASEAVQAGPPMPKVWFLNNIFSARKFFVGYEGQDGGHMDHNWIGGDGVRKLPRMGKHNLLAAGQRLWDPVKPDFRLKKDSPARNIGIDLSRPFTVNGVEHPPLPGMRPGYFSGDRPDAGAIQYAGD